MDHNIFMDGWDKKNSYVYGWIVSDGCLLKEGRNKTAYAVRISTNDIDIAQWMHLYMCDGNKLYKQHYDNYVIKYRNQDAIKFMMQNKLTSKKSLTMEFPENIPREFIWDFIRGYFDGDGSVVLRKTKYNLYGQISFTSGSQVFLERLQQVLSEYDINSHIYKDNRASNKSYYLRVIKRSEIEKLYHKLYDEMEDGAFLWRKYFKYYQLMMAKPKYQIV